MRPLSARSSTGPAAHAATLPPPTARPALRLLAFSLPLRSLRLGPCTAAAAGGGAGGECFGLGPGAKHSSSGGLQDGRHRRRDRQAVGSEVIIPHCLSGLEPQPTPHTAPAAAALDRSTHPPVTASEPPKEEASASRASSLSHSASCAQLAPPLSLPPPSRLPLAACVGLPSRLAAVQNLAMHYGRQLRRHHLYSKEPHAGWRLLPCQPTHLDTPPPWQGGCPRAGSSSWRRRSRAGGRCWRWRLSPQPRPARGRGKVQRGAGADGD